MGPDMLSSLAIIAVLAGVLQAGKVDCFAWDAGGTFKHVPAACNSASTPLDDFKAGNGIQDGSDAGSIVRFRAGRAAFMAEVATPNHAGLLAAYLTQTHEMRTVAYARALLPADVKALVGHLEGDGGDARKAANNKAITRLLSQTQLARFPEGIAASQLQMLVDRAKADGVSIDFGLFPLAVLTEHAELLITAVPRLHALEPAKLRSMLELPNVAEKLVDEAAFTEMVRASRAHAQLFEGALFARLGPDVHTKARLGSLVRRLPEGVFEAVSRALHDDYLRYASAAQLSKLQQDVLPDEDTALGGSVPSAIRAGTAIPGQLAGSVPAHAWLAYLSQHGAAKVPTASKVRFWKRVPVQAIRRAVEHVPVENVMFWTELRLLSREQRQSILDAGDQSASATSCELVDAEIFKGKQARHADLRLSPACVESAGRKPVAKRAAFFWSAMASRAVQAGDMGGAWDAPMVRAFSSKIPQPPQVDPHTGSVRNKGRTHALHGILAFEAMKGAGEAYLAALLGLGDADGIVPDACAAINKAELRVAPWMQARLSAACVEAMPAPTLHELVGLDANILGKLGEEQVARLNLRHNMAALAKPAFAPVLAGLQHNRHFVALVLARDEAAGLAAPSRPLLLSLGPAVRAAGLGAGLVAGCPEDRESRATLAEHIASLGEGALAQSTHAALAANPGLLRNCSDAQFGRASDDVDDDASSYPAHLTAAEARALPAARVSALSAKFVSRLRDAALGSLSAAQVQALAPAALARLTAAQLALLRGALTAEQAAAVREATGKPSLL